MSWLLFANVEAMIVAKMIGITGASLPEWVKQSLTSILLVLLSVALALQ